MAHQRPAPSSPGGRRRPRLCQAAGRDRASPAGLRRQVRRGDCAPDKQRLPPGPESSHPEAPRGGGAVGQASSSPKTAGQFFCNFESIGIGGDIQRGGGRLTHSRGRVVLTMSFLFKHHFIFNSGPKITPRALILVCKHCVHPGRSTVLNPDGAAWCLVASPGGGRGRGGGYTSCWKQTKS